MLENGTRKKVDRSDGWSDIYVVCPESVNEGGKWRQASFLITLSN
jgi:hypothetical protein